MGRGSQGGRPFGRYRLLERLARGGMAEIWLARYEGAAGVERSVVLKKILPAFADDARFVEMFIDEARISVGLDHGNIAQVYDFGEVEGEYYLAMEYVNGQSLSRIRRRIARQGLVFPVPVACYVMMEVCQGLHYAHTRTDASGRPLNIVHRDVSPQNVMVSYDGQVKLVDFGIAKAASVAGKTEAGALKGKLPYFSPEQAKNAPLDARTDVFAAGTVLYELLTGELPFRGHQLAVMRNIIEGRFEKPTEIAPWIPRRLERVLLEAMEPDPQRRSPSALAIQEGLGGILRHEAKGYGAENLAELVRWLFSEELSAKGHRPVPSAAFLEDLPRWRRTAVESRDPSETTTWRHPRPPRPRTVALGAAGLLAAVGIGLGLAGRSAPATTSTIESDPPGARILIDGQKIGATTPHVLEGLQAGRSHGVTLTLDGHRTWMGILTAGEDVHTRLEPIVEPRAVPSRPRLSELMQAEGTGTAQARARTAAFDFEGTLVDLARVRTAQLPLDQARGHAFEIHGNVRMSRATHRADVPWAAWYAVYPDAPDRTGLVGGIHGDVLSLPAGAVEIHFLIVEHQLLSPTGGALTVREIGGPRTLRIDPARHLLRLRPYVAGISGLDAATWILPLQPSRRSRITFHVEGELEGGPQGVVMWRGNLLGNMGQMTSTDPWAGLLTDGESIEIEGFPGIHLFLIHADPAAAHGSIRFTLEDLGPSPVDTARAAFQAGFALHERGAYAEAVPHLERALDLDPEGQSVAHGLLGSCFEALGEVDRARTHFRHFLETNPGHRRAPEARRRLATLERAARADR